MGNVEPNCEFYNYYNRHIQGYIFKDHNNNYAIILHTKINFIEIDSYTAGYAKYRTLIDYRDNWYIYNRTSVKLFRNRENLSLMFYAFSNSRNCGYIGQINGINSHFITRKIRDSYKYDLNLKILALQKKLKIYKNVEYKLIHIIRDFLKISFDNIKIY